MHVFSPRAKNLLSWLAYGAIMLAFFAVVYNIYRDHHKVQFSDAYDYITGLRAFAAGQDAYGVAPGAEWTGFIYPPLILEIAGALFRDVPHPLLWTVYLGLVFLSVAVTPWLLSKLGGRSLWFLPFVAALVFVAEPNRFSLRVTLGANVSVILYGLLLASLLWSLRRGRWTALYLATFLAALVKPTFLAFLLLPLLAGVGQAMLCGVTAVGVVAAYLLQWLIWPALYAGFRESVYTELVRHKDYGLGVFCLIYEHTHTRVAFMQWTGSLLAHALVIAAMVVFFWRAHRLRTQPGLCSLWVPALVVLAILANPRPIWYDHYVSWVLGVFLVVEWLRTATSWRARVVAGIWVLACEVFLYREDPDMIYAGLLLAVLALVFIRAWSMRTAPQAIETFYQRTEPAPFS